VSDKKIDVCAISRLARLELCEGEAERLECEMRQFDEFAACLDSFCAEGIVIEDERALVSCSRKDECLASNVRPEELIALSQGAKNGYISVPITVGKEDGEK